MWWSNESRIRSDIRSAAAEAAKVQAEKELDAARTTRVIAHEIAEWHRKIQVDNHFALKLRTALGK